MNIQGGNPTYVILSQRKKKEAKNFNVGFCFDICGPVSFKLGMMIVIAVHYLWKLVV